MSDFVAWLPDADALDALQSLGAALPGAWPDLPPLRPRTRRQLHMTLRFLAEGLPDDPARLYAALAQVAADTPRIEIRIDRVEAWPGANVVVARTAPSPALDALFAALESAARGCGHAPEPGSATPHLTLAYAARSQRLAALAPPAALLPLPIQTCLGSITLARTGPGRYDSLQWWPLGEPADDIGRTE